MGANYGPAILAVCVSVLLAVMGLFYRMGHLTGNLSTRVEELERWRNTIRQDMHEISDALEDLAQKIVTLTTLIGERTERRMVARDSSRDYKGGE